MFPGARAAWAALPLLADVVISFLRIVVRRFRFGATDDDDRC